MSRLCLLSLVAVSGCCVVLDGSDAPIGPFYEANKASGAAPSRARADADPTLSVIAFVDLQCPFSRRLLVDVLRLRVVFGTNVRWTLRHNPLPVHDRAEPAAVAVLAAERQGKGFELAGALARSKPLAPPERIADLARGLGIDLERFARDRQDVALLERAQADRALAVRSGAAGTPTLFIGSRKIVGARPYAELEAALREGIEAARAAAGARL